MDVEFLQEQARLNFLRRMLAIGGPRPLPKMIMCAPFGSRELLSVPIAYVSIIDEHCQCLAAVVGTSNEETPREHSIIDPA